MTKKKCKKTLYPVRNVILQEAINWVKRRSIIMIRSFMVTWATSCPDALTITSFIVLHAVVLQYCSAELTSDDVSHIFNETLILRVCWKGKHVDYVQFKSSQSDVWPGVVLLEQHARIQYFPLENNSKNNSVRKQELSSVRTL